MCGRIILITPAAELVRALGIDTVPPWAAADLPSYNVAPGRPIPAVVVDPAAAADSWRLRRFHWGLVPAWAQTRDQSYRMINARSETVADKPAFREPFRRRRCLIPVDGFYEWQRKGNLKQPYVFRPAEGRLLTLAGIWEQWERPDQEPLASCSILTTAANAVMRRIHDRMPVILSPADHAAWLTTPPENSDRLTELLRPCPPHWLAAYPVDRRVNRPDFDGPACLEPAPDAETGLSDASPSPAPADAEKADDGSGQFGLF